MTKKGKSNANVANGTVIETLVILSADLVQVVAEVYDSLFFICLYVLLGLLSILLLLCLNNLFDVHMWFCTQGVQLPADGIAGNYDGDDVEAVAGTVPPFEGQISEAKRPIRSGMNKRRNQKR